MPDHPRNWDESRDPMEGRITFTLTQLRRNWSAFSACPSTLLIITPDVHESPEDRILTMLDSWVHPDEDKGNTSCRSICFVVVQYDHADFAGILDIPWSEVLSTFDGVYLSWDPSLWTQQLTLHGYMFSCYLPTPALLTYN